jgi:hypothetical protein
MAAEQADTKGSLRGADASMLVDAQRSHPPKSRTLINPLEFCVLNTSDTYLGELGSAFGSVPQRLEPVAQI